MPMDSDIPSPDFAQAPASAPADPAAAAGSMEDRVVQLVQSFQFRQPTLLTSTELRKLRLRYEAFIRSLATRMSIFLRMEFSLEITLFDAQPYERAIAMLPSPTHVTLFKVDPLPGVGYIEMPVEFAIGIVDRLLGGPGQPVALERSLTEIEVALLDQAITLLLKEWAHAVTGLAQAVPAGVGHENQPQFLQMAAEDAPMLVAALDAHLGEASSRLHLVVPLGMLESLLRQWVAPAEQQKKPSTPPPAPALKWNPALSDVRVPVSACWDNITISARELASLRVGDVLPIPMDQLGQTHLRLARQNKFTGRLGKCGDSWAIEVSQHCQK